MVQLKEIDARLEEPDNNISIPHGTIKSQQRLESEIEEIISIPHGTIKSLL